MFILGWCFRRVLCSCVRYRRVFPDVFALLYSCQLQVWSRTLTSHLLLIPIVTRVGWPFEDLQKRRRIYLCNNESFNVWWVMLFTIVVLKACCVYAFVLIQLRNQLFIVIAFCKQRARLPGKQSLFSKKMPTKDARNSLSLRLIVIISAHLTSERVIYSSLLFLSSVVNWRGENVNYTSFA